MMYWFEIGDWSGWAPNEWQAKEIAASRATRDLTQPEYRGERDMQCAARDAGFI